MPFRPERMQFGVFMPPLHHQPSENPTLSLAEDLEFAEEPVTMKTDRFELRDARIQLASYTKPHLSVAEIPAFG